MLDSIMHVLGYLIDHWYECIAISYMVYIVLEIFFIKYVYERKVWKLSNIMEMCFLVGIAALLGPINIIIIPWLYIDLLSSNKSHSRIKSNFKDLNLVVLDTRDKK